MRRPVGVASTSHIHQQESPCRVTKGHIARQTIRLAQACMPPLGMHTCSLTDWVQCPLPRCYLIWLYHISLLPCASSPSRSSRSRASIPRHTQENMPKSPLPSTSRYAESRRMLPSSESSRSRRLQALCVARGAVFPRNCYLFAVVVATAAATSDGTAAAAAAAAIVGTPGAASGKHVAAGRMQD